MALTAHQAGGSIAYVDQEMQSGKSRRAKWLIRSLPISSYMVGLGLLLHFSFLSASFLSTFSLFL